MINSFQFELQIIRSKYSRPGGTLIFSYIRMLGSFFGVQNFEFQFFWGGFQKNGYFFGYEDFVEIFWVVTKLDYI